MSLVETLTAKAPPLRAEADGVVRVGETRVSLDTLIGAFANGCGPEEIVLKYPTLDLTDVYAVITYYLWHRDEVEAYLSRRRAQAEETRRQLDVHLAKGVRERLLARRGAKD